MMIWMVVSKVGEASAQSSGVCDRTEQVRDAIVAASGAGSCSQVTELHHLREITALDLSNQGIASLGAGDFEGLVRVATLDLSGNSLTALPEGVFDGLYLLRTLRLDNNQLTTVPEDLFDRLWLLEELTVSGNPGLALEDDLFDEFAELAGFLTDGAMPDNSGTYPRIQRFLDKHAVTSPVEFIEALPTLYKQRFSWVYKSDALAQDHVSFEHPRFLSWGADGRYIFAWNTDPDAPEDLLEAIEFLRQDDDDWVAGVIEFSEGTPHITEPTSCQTCHGSLNKPLWGAYRHWDGAEFDGRRPSDEVTKSAMQLVLESDHARIEPLDFDASSSSGRGIERLLNPNPAERYLHLPGYYPEAWAVEEAGVIFSLRHAEVLFQRLKDRQDYWQRAERTVCTAEPHDAREQALSTFSEAEHNPAIMATTGAVVQAIDGVSSLARAPDYHYHVQGELGGAVIFLMVADLWEREPVVRHLYRTTSNADTILDKHGSMSDRMLYYQAGYATAEDELIQKLRLQFGHGNRASLAARANQYTQSAGYGITGSLFFDGHLEVMAPRVCDALRNSKPENLAAETSRGRVLLNWDEPGWDTGSVTGYRILHGADPESLEVLVDNTGTTTTAWTDRDPAPGDHVYAVQAIYGDHYPSPQSDRVSHTVTEHDLGPQPPAGLTGTATDWSVELNWSVPVQPEGVYFDAMHLERLDAGDAVVWSTEVYDDDPAGYDWRHTVSHLDAATAYRFRVKLPVDGGDPVYSEVLAVTTQSDPPVGPSGLSAVPAAESVALSWEIPAQPGWLAGGGPVDVLREMVSPRTETEHRVNDEMVWQRGNTSWQFTDTGVSPGFTYRYRIRTYFGGRHQYSDSVEVTIPARVLDPDSVPGGATALEVSAPTRLPRHYGPYSIHRGGGDAVDYFTFTTDARYQLRLRVDMHDRYIDTDVHLEDAGGDVVAQSSLLPGREPVEWIDAVIGPGTYYIQVQAAADGSTGYILRLGLTDPSAGPLTGFTLVDASDQSVLATLTDGATVTLDDPGGGSYAIRAGFDPAASIGSVIFELTGAKTVPAKTENWVPYSLYGDHRDGQVRNLNGEALPAGSYTLKATAYTHRRGNGDVLGSLEVSFTVTNG